MPARPLPVAATGVLVGVLLGVVGAFWIPLRVGGVRLPLAPVLVPLAVVVACRLAGVASGSRLAATAPAVGWTLAVLVLAMRGPGGDVVVPGGDPVATAYLLVGAVAAAVGAAVGLPLTRRPPTG